MTESKLLTLIEKMYRDSFSSGSSKSVAWRAYRKAEKLDDPELLPVLRDLINTNDSNDKKDFRKSAYFIMISLLSKTMIPDYCQFIIDRLGKETDIYVLESMLRGIGRKLKIPDEVDPEHLINCCKNDKWLVRHSAIAALCASNTEESREAARFWVRQSDEKTYKDEIIYAISSLSVIGEECDIGLIDRHIHSGIRDIRESASYAINRINAKIGSHNTDPALPR